MKTKLTSILASLFVVLCLNGCSSLPPSVVAFNAAAGPRIAQDAQVAASAAASAAASSTAAQLQSGGKSGGKVDPSAIGTSAAVSAVAALAKLDIQRATQTNP